MNTEIAKDPGAADRRWNVPMVIGAALALFAFLAVNYWIYTARLWFLSAHADTYPRPPTISRAISVPEIGAPFAIWVSLSAVCLIFAVALLARYYNGLRHHMVRPRWTTAIALWVVVPSAVVLQAISGWGIYTQSVHTLYTAPKMHMFASTVFFASQAAVILCYALINAALLRDRSNLDRIVKADAMRLWWVRARFAFSVFAVGCTLLFGVLFKLKDVFPYEEVRWVHLIYVSAEPLVITVFLSTVVLAFADKLRH